MRRQVNPSGLLAFNRSARPARFIPAPTSQCSAALWWGRRKGYGFWQLMKRRTVKNADSH